MTTTRKAESCCGPVQAAGDAESDLASACCSESGSAADASACCDLRAESAPEPGVQASKRSLDIEFLYLDLSVCERCRDTESTLEEALAEVSRVLQATGVDVALNKIHVTSEQQATDLGFVVSPTIRVDGRDIQMNFRESLCDSCATLCDCEGGVSCREWEYQGQWYTAPPRGLIIESILSVVYGGVGNEHPESAESETAAENLKRFFSGRREQESQGSAEK